MHISPALISTILNAKHITLLTGAGVSQESGIPTFRDRLTGYWENYDPEELATRAAFKKQPDIVWQWYAARRRLIEQSQPNAAHYGIVRLESVVGQLDLITQNVDDLHERAGSREMTHLHGSIFSARCFACGRPHAHSANDQASPPRCLHCGGTLRPGVVWFGEDLPAPSWHKAKRAAASCSVFICIGTSGIVTPASTLPLIASQNRATVIDINTEYTEISRLARFSVQARAGEFFSQLCQNLK